MHNITGAKPQINLMFNAAFIFSFIVINQFKNQVSQSC